MCVLKLGENDDIGAHVENGEGIETACGSDHISTKTKTAIFQDVLEFDGRNSPFVPEQFCRFSSLPVFKMVFPTIASLLPDLTTVNYLATRITVWRTWRLK